MLPTRVTPSLPRYEMRNWVLLVGVRVKAPLSPRVSGTVVADTQIGNPLLVSCIRVVPMLQTKKLLVRSNPKKSVASKFNRGVVPALKSQYRLPSPSKIRSLVGADEKPTTRPPSKWPWPNRSVDVPRSSPPADAGDSAEDV